MARIKSDLYKEFDNRMDQVKNTLKSESLHLQSSIIATTEANNQQLYQKCEHLSQQIDAAKRELNLKVNKSEIATDLQTISTYSQNLDESAEKKMLSKMMNSKTQTLEPTNTAAQFENTNHNQRTYSRGRSNSRRNRRIDSSSRNRYHNYNWREDRRSNVSSN